MMITVDAFTASLVAIVDDAVCLEVIEAALEGLPVRGETAADPHAGMELVLRAGPEIVLLDLTLPGTSGMDLLERILDAAPETEIILLSQTYSTGPAIEAIQGGAADYLGKPPSIDLLRRRIVEILEHLRERRMALELDAEMLKTYSFEGLVGRSPLMLELFRKIGRVAPHFRTALITGAAGTGKELAAMALHRLSRPSPGSFTALQCPAVADVLFEGELFGCLSEGAGGAVFLDEIGGMPLETQARLLRVLEDGEAQKARALVIASTNSDLRARVAQGLFLEELYRRLAAIEIRLPRLVERREDLPLLERRFLEEFSRQYGKMIRGIAPRAQLLLARYSWPGNVRELRSVLQSACMTAASDTIDVRDLPEFLRAAPMEESEEGAEPLTLAEVERRHVRRVLDSVEGNKTRAARILGINRATVYRILQEKTKAAGA